MSEQRGAGAASGAASGAGVWRQREIKERKRARDRSRERMAAAATITTPQLVDKSGAQSAIWNYFGLKTNEDGEAINSDAPLCKRCYKTCVAKGGNTSNLAKHLKDKHPDLHKEFRERQVVTYIPMKKSHIQC